MKAFDFFEKSILAIECDSVHIKALLRGFIRQRLHGVGLRFRFGPKSRFEVKYFCVHMSHLGYHQDCLNLATNPNLRPTSIVGNMLLQKFNLTVAFKADVIIRSVNKI